MAKVIFWNTARGTESKNVKSETLDNMVDNLIALSARDPELIVLGPRAP
ncbi:MAG: hypothetical protein ACRERU_16195 [Methylococcales bacterium]